MKKYEVRLYDTYIRIVTVEAESPEAAIKQAREWSVTVRPEFVEQGDEVVYEVNADGELSDYPVLET